MTPESCFTTSLPTWYQISENDNILRYMTWLTFRNNNLQGTQMCIVTGQRIDLAITLIDRMKKLFKDKGLVTFDSKETVIELNRVHIEAYPSHHLDAIRSGNRITTP
jgi:hypothetical protein